jgi:hypothetical protein
MVFRTDESGVKITKKINAGTIVEGTYVKLGQKEKGRSLPGQ